MGRATAKRRSSTFTLAGVLRILGLGAREVSMISKHPRLDEPSLRTEAPAPHIDAIMKALDATDRAVSPLMDLGMDPRVALILKEMEKAGALLVRNVDGEIFVDVYDKRRAIEFIDKLKAELVT